MGQSIITYIALPFTFLIILFGGVGVRREIKWLVYLLFLGELAGLAYFLYKLYGVRPLRPSEPQLSKQIASTWNSSLFVVPRHTLITFNLVCIVLLLFLGLSSGIVYSNFGRGLAERCESSSPRKELTGDSAGVFAADADAWEEGKYRGGRDRTDGNGLVGARMDNTPARSQYLH